MVAWLELYVHISALFTTGAEAFALIAPAKVCVCAPLLVAVPDIAGILCVWPTELFPVLPLDLPEVLVLGFPVGLV